MVIKRNKIIIPFKGEFWTDPNPEWRKDFHIWPSRSSLEIRASCPGGCRFKSHMSRKNEYEIHSSYWSNPCCSWLQACIVNFKLRNTFRWKRVKTLRVAMWTDRWSCIAQCLSLVEGQRSKHSSGMSPDRDTALVEDKPKTDQTNAILQPQTNDEWAKCCLL